MRRVLAVTTAVCALVAMPACGGKTNEAARAAGITPSSALAFITISLDPAIEQKKNLLSIARAFPAAKVKDEFQSARDDLLQRLLASSGLDYKTDVKPWLGNEVAVAALPAAAPGTAPFAAVFIAAKDPGKAEAALAKAEKQAGGAKTQHRVISGYEVIVSADGTEGTAALDAIAKEAKGSSGGLAKSAAFTDAVAELHGDRLLLGWVDSERALNALKDAGGDSLPPQFSFAKSFANAKPVAFDLHAADKAIVLEAATRATVQSKGGEPRLAESLPAATIAVLTAFDVGGSLKQALAQVGGAGGDDPSKAFKDATGLDLQSDVLSWMGGEITTAVGPAPAGEDIPDFALIIETTDHAKAAASIPHIRDAVIKQAGSGKFKQQTIAGVSADVLSDPIQGTVQPAMALLADRFVIASRPAYLAQVAAKAPSPLGDSAPYRSVVGTGTSGKTLFQTVVRIDPLRELLENAFGMADDEDYVKNTRPNLVPLDVLGARAYRLGEFDRFELKLTVS
jgi:hypothetical protein